jgi:hypothetical protein
MTPKDGYAMCEHRTLYPSLDALLSPASLSVIAGQPITDVHRLPYPALTTSASGNCFLSVETNNGQGPRYIVKRISLEWDWIMRASGDCQAREVRVWQFGLLDRLPDETLHTVVACARDGDPSTSSGQVQWAILMQDVSPALFGISTNPFSIADIDTILDAMAALHARFWRDPMLDDSELGLCPAERLYTCFSPRTGYGPEPQPAEIAASDAGTAPPWNVGALRWIGDGWQQLERVVEPDVAGVVRELLDDPRPLVEALARYPRTLVHGDMRRTNLGFASDDQCSRLILLDWQLVSQLPPAVDLAWFIDRCYNLLPLPVDDAIEHYRQRLAHHLGDRYSDDWWQPQLELSLLGQFLRAGWTDLYGSVHGETEATRVFGRTKLALLSAWVSNGVKWL